MFTGVRPCLSAGVALVGASVIAVTPISPAPAAIAAASPAVQLAAIPSPLQLYPQVFVESLTNAGALLEQYFADPFPIIAATLQNQAAAFEDAVTALQFGRFDEFFAAVGDIVLQPLKSAGQALAHLDAIFRQPFALEGFFIIAISPVLSGIAATGLAIADVFEAITTFDVIGLVNAVINIPARIIDGVLNGVPGASFGIFEDLPGLLSPTDSSLPPGPIAVAIGLDQDMGAAITPEAPAAIDGWSDPEAQTMMLTTEPETEPLPVYEESAVEGETVLGENAPVAEELDLPTSDVPGDEVPGDEVPGDELSEEEADDLVAEEEPAPAPEQTLPDAELADDNEPSSPTPTDDGNDPGTETTD